MRVRPVSQRPRQRQSTDRCRRSQVDGLAGGSPGMRRPEQQRRGVDCTSNPEGPQTESKKARRMQQGGGGGPLGCSREKTQGKRGFTSNSKPCEGSLLSKLGVCIRRLRKSIRSFSPLRDWAEMSVSSRSRTRCSLEFPMASPTTCSTAPRPQPRKPRGDTCLPPPSFHYTPCFLQLLFPFNSYTK